MNVLGKIIYYTILTYFGINRGLDGQPANFNFYYNNSINCF